MACEQFPPKPLILNNRDIYLFCYCVIYHHHTCRSKGSGRFGAFVHSLRRDLSRDTWQRLEWPVAVCLRITHRLTVETPTPKPRTPLRQCVRLHGPQRSTSGECLRGSSRVWHSRS